MTKRQLFSYIDSIPNHRMDFLGVNGEFRVLTKGHQIYLNEYLRLEIYDEEGEQRNYYYRLSWHSEVILWKMYHDDSSKKLATGWEALRQFEKAAGRSFMRLDLLIP